MLHTDHAAGVAILVGLLCLAVGSSALAGGAAPPPADEPAAALLPAPTSSSPSFALAVRVDASGSRPTTCQGGRHLIAVGPSLLTRAKTTPLVDECLSCCNEYIFADDFEIGAATNWSAVVGG